MNKEDYESVVADLRLKVGEIVNLAKSPASKTKQHHINFLLYPRRCLRDDPLPPNQCFPLRLQNGLLFSIPVVLDTNRDDIVPGDKVLVTYQGQNIAVVTIESKYVDGAQPSQAYLVF